MSLRREERTASLRAGQTLQQQQDLDMEDAVALEQRNQELARLHESVCVWLFPVVELLVSRRCTVGVVHSSGCGTQ